jgi:hypothetical protein
MCAARWMVLEIKASTVNLARPWQRFDLFLLEMKQDFLVALCFGQFVALTLPSSTRKRSETSLKVASATALQHKQNRARQVNASQHLGV